MDGTKIAFQLNSLKANMSDIYSEMWALFLYVKNSNNLS